MNSPSKEDMISALKKRHGEELQAKISGCTAAICGLGGLGSNIAVCLARAGIGRMILIDFDRVDISNLHRQQYKACQTGMYKTDALKENLIEISPYLDLETHTVKLDTDNFQDYLSGVPIVCEAFDDPDAKSMLVNCILEHMPETYVIAASGMAGLGSPNDIKTRKITSHFYLCGDGVSNVSEETGLFSSRVMLCAAHQAHTVLRIISGMEES